MLWRLHEYVGTNLSAPAAESQRCRLESERWVNGESLRPKVRDVCAEPTEPWWNSSVSTNSLHLPVTPWCFHSMVCGSKVDQLILAGCRPVVPIWVFGLRQSGIRLWYECGWVTAEIRTNRFDREGKSFDAGSCWNFLLSRCCHQLPDWASIVFVRHNFLFVKMFSPRHRGHAMTVSCRDGDCVRVSVCVLACAALPLAVLSLCPGSAEACPNRAAAKRAPPKLLRTGSGLFCFTGWASEAAALLSPSCLAFSPSSRSGQYLVHSSVKHKMSTVTIKRPCSKLFWVIWRGVPNILLPLKTL